MADHYDVAISFLSKDEPLAAQLCAALAPLRVFLYSKEQEEVAGREGVEAFREVFRYKSTLSVVLYRGGWGSKGFTGVEETAIQDRCLADGWGHLFFVRLDQATAPKWVPESRIYLDLRTFGMGDLVGAVKARLVELGVSLRLPTPAERAKRIAEEERFNAETVELLRQSAQPLYNACADLFSRVETRLVDVERDTGWTVDRDTDFREFVAFLHAATVQLFARWRETISGDSVLTVRLFEGRRLGPKSRSVGHRTFNEPRELSKWDLTLTRRPDVGFCWQNGKEVRVADDVADWVVNELLTARQAASKAEPGRP